MSNKHIRLLVVDDHPVLRDSLVNLLTACSPQLQVIAQAGNVQDALVLAEQTNPDMVLTDLQMSPQNGIDLIHALRKQQPNIRYVVFTALTDEEHLLKAFDAGAEGFLTKDAEAHELVKAIESVMAGATSYPAKLKLAINRREQQPNLTPREREVITLVAQGLTSKEIARRLSIDPRTVDVHRANVRQRFGFSSSAALLHFAVATTGAGKS